MEVIALFLRRNENMRAAIEFKSAFQVRLIRSKVGSEEYLVHDLNEKNPRSLYFKVLGNFDILEIALLDSLDEATHVHSDERILAINSFPCFCLKTLEQHFANAIATSNVASLILIKLQDHVFLKSGMKGLLEVAKKLHSGVGDHKPFPLINMGYFEIVLWFPTSDFNSIFNYIDQVRRLLISEVIDNFHSAYRGNSLLLESITLPCISYKNIILPKNWDLLKEKITPFLKIKCAPGHEGAIAKKIPTECYHLLGADDLLCRWQRPIEFGEFLKFILEFRKNMPEFTLTDTITRLYHFKEITSFKEETPIPPSIDPPARGLFDALDKMAKEDGVNKFIMGEIINIVSLINIHIGNRTLGKSFFELTYSILEYLNGLLIRYHIAIKNKERDNISILEALLLSYANCIRSSISQQFSNKGYSDYYDVGSHPTFACSLARIIKAISILPEQLFGIISKSKPPEKFNELSQKEISEDRKSRSSIEYHRPWVGFLFLDLKEGYSIFQQGELFTVPYKDIFSFSNWITLSHEVSHGYYVRIQFEEIETDYLTNILPKKIENLPTEIKEFYDLWRIDTIFELFAHWFDYRHFFDSDFDFYIWSIWKTYLEVPRVYKNKLEYWARSLFVKIASHWNELEPQLNAIYDESKNPVDMATRISGIFLKELEAMHSVLASKFSGSFGMLTLDGKDMEQVARMLLPYYDLCRLFEKNYVNNDIISGTNRKYSGLANHIKAILNGKIITTKIPNPFLLLREIHRGVYEGKYSDHFKDEAALALIFSFWEASRKYKRSRKTA